MGSSFRLPGGDLEVAVLRAVWDQGRATARVIHTRVGVRKHLAYTTIAKVLDRLCEKGLLVRERDGAAFAYEAAVDRVLVERARVKQVLGRILSPEVRPALATLIDAVESIDPKLLDELSRQVEARRRSRRGS